MMTRNLFEPTHGPGMATNVANAHGQMVYAPMIVGPSLGLLLPGNHVAYDPSDITTAAEPHIGQVAPEGHAQVATRSMYFLQTAQ